MAYALLLSQYVPVDRRCNIWSKITLKNVMNWKFPIYIEVSVASVFVRNSNYFLFSKIQYFRKTFWEFQRSMQSQRSIKSLLWNVFTVPASHSNKKVVVGKWMERKQEWKKNLLVTRTFIFRKKILLKKHSWIGTCCLCNNCASALKPMKPVLMTKKLWVLFC